VANPTKFVPACNWASPDPGNPRCDKQDPFESRILNIEERSDGFVITVAVGADNHAGSGWTVSVLAGASDTPLVGGAGKVFQATKTQIKARVRLSREQLDKNLRVRVSPP